MLCRKFIFIKQIKTSAKSFSQLFISQNVGEMFSLIDFVVDEKAFANIEKVVFYIVKINLKFVDRGRGQNIFKWSFVVCW